MAASRGVSSVCRGCSLRTTVFPARQFTTSIPGHRADNKGPSRRAPSPLTNLISPKQSSPLDLSSSRNPAPSSSEPSRSPRRSSPAPRRATSHSVLTELGNPEQGAVSNSEPPSLLENFVKSSAMRGSSPLGGMEESTALKQRTRDIEATNQRSWEEGDQYAPTDLGPAAMRHARHQARQTYRAQPANTRRHGQPDILDVLNIDPVKSYKNFALIDDFITDMGRIKHSKMMGLRAVNQRKVAKAVRRAHGMGLLPTTHRHPMMLPEVRDQLEQKMDLDPRKRRTHRSSNPKVFTQV